MTKPSKHKIGDYVKIVNNKYLTGAFAIITSKKFYDYNDLWVYNIKFIGKNIHYNTKSEPYDNNCNEWREAVLQKVKIK